MGLDTVELVLEIEAQLVERCVDSNRITNEFGPDDEEAVWQAVVKLVSKIAGVDEERLTPETNFLNDLGF